MRASSGPICDDAGGIVGAVLVMTDVTEQKDEAERLTYLAGLLDTTEDAIVALDAEWFVTVWNTGAERMYGWTADEVLGRHTLEVARLAMSYEERAEVRSAVAEHGRWRGEVVAYRKDGAPVCVELIIVALRGERGGVTGYLGIHRDVSERKRAEQDLREARRRSETILESISDSFASVDRDWRYTYVNERALAEAAPVPGAEPRGRGLPRQDRLGVVPGAGRDDVRSRGSSRAAGAGCGGARDALSGHGAVDGCPPVPVGSGAVDLRARHHRAQADR